MYCTALTLKGYDRQQLRLNVPKVVRMKTQVVTKPQSDECIEAISKVKAADQLSPVTVGGHIVSDDYFKSQVLLESTVRIKELELDKVRIQERIMLQIDKDNVMRAKKSFDTRNEG